MKIFHNDVNSDSLLTLEYAAKFSALKNKDFPRFLEEMQTIARSVPFCSEDVSYGNAESVEEPPGNYFTIILRVSSDSWSSAERRFDELINEILAVAKTVEYQHKDTALERHMKSSNERLVSRAGQTVKQFS
jgi:hypothetical protein